MYSFKDTIRKAEISIGLPGFERDYDGLGQDIKEYAERIWPRLAAQVLVEFASDIFNDICYKSPIEQKMYLALKHKYIEYFLGHPNNTALLVDKKLSEISSFLVKRGGKPIYTAGDVDYEIDLFLYLDCFILDGPNGSHIRYPIFLGIECDGHDYHEKTRQQAQKDKSKDRILKKNGIDVVRFTGSEITSRPDFCSDEIDELVVSRLNEISSVLKNIR